MNLNLDPAGKLAVAGLTPPRARFFMCRICGIRITFNGPVRPA